MKNVDFLNESQGSEKLEEEFLFNMLKTIRSIVVDDKTA
jgi:hypothetical protein